MLLYYFVSSAKGVAFQVDDDIIDKLNYFYTTAVIIGKAIWRLNIKIIILYDLKIHF